MSTRWDAEAHARETIPADEWEEYRANSAARRRREPMGRPNGHCDDGVSLDDLWAHMPSHSYIFAPTREMWPAASVNSRLPRIDGIAAAAWLDHVERVFPLDYAHIIKWLAHRVQKPQQKINHALVLGGLQGNAPRACQEHNRTMEFSRDFADAIDGTF